MDERKDDRKGGEVQTPNWSEGRVQGLRPRTTRTRSCHLHLSSTTARAPPFLPSQRPRRRSSLQPVPEGWSEQSLGGGIGEPEK
eukprot:1053761-Rhodomonas_salina.1